MFLLFASVLQGPGPVGSDAHMLRFNCLSLLLAVFRKRPIIAQCVLAIG